MLKQLERPTKLAQIHLCSTRRLPTAPHPLSPQSVCRPIRLSSPCGLLFYAIIAGVWLPFGINLYAVAVADGNYHFIIAGEAGRATTATAAATACITSSHTSFYSFSSSTYVSTCGSASTSASVTASTHTMATLLNSH